MSPLESITVSLTRHTPGRSRTVSTLRPDVYDLPFPGKGGIGNLLAGGAKRRAETNRWREAERNADAQVLSFEFLALTLYRHISGEASELTNGVFPATCNPGGGSEKTFAAGFPSLRDQCRRDRDP
ncbi:hypothetical protein KAU37_06520 [Candidatus Bipolaricaulota bacterium]|nr:hypothetical protein [Candidatus Bipolaricaulota bacterium]